TGAYWSSTEYDSDEARTSGFVTGTQSWTEKTGNLRVRPIRAFGGTTGCADGGTCAVGDTGPGGGKVFYVHSSGTFSCGRALTSTCRYLEAATSDQSAAVVWATNVAACYADASDTGNLDCRDYSVYSDSAGQTASRTASRAIGAGLSNTVQIHSRLTAVGGAAVSSYAAGIAYAYSAGGLSDWYLPSVDELRQLFLQRLTVGGFAADSYWASSENSRDIASRIDFVFGTPDTGYKSPLEIRVRPIRAFGGTTGCADGGACAVGDTGPGGGIVFYVHSSGTFTSTGSDCGTSCKYLEAARSDQSTGVVWCSNDSSPLGVTATAIGSGMANTTTADTTCSSGAIQIAADYSNNGKTDWHLPSKDELNELCKYAKNTGQAAGGATLCSGGADAAVRGFTATNYWSSSEDSALNAWQHSFFDGSRGANLKGAPTSNRVRVVRAFG
ncbi:MAG: DUF1566 domain-containing protein, partial [bacterium]|nr:DUF1566 domain-containing protein [Candidatus Aquidulcis sp.]